MKEAISTAISTGTIVTYLSESLRTLKHILDHPEMDRQETVIKLKAVDRWLDVAHSDVKALIRRKETRA